MNLYEAAHLARTLMNGHGLQSWSFRFDHARRRFGCCNYTRHCISLSKPLTFLNSEADVRDTLLHEIGHALTPGAGHGPRWRAKCIEIGARPVRCYREDAVVSPPRPAAPYRFGCPRCQWWVPRRRRMRLRHVCSRCGNKVVYEVVATPPTPAEPREAGRMRELIRSAGPAPLLPK